MSELELLFTDAEREVLAQVRNRAANLSSIIPNQRQGDSLYLDPKDWETLRIALNRLLEETR